MNNDEIKVMNSLADFFNKHHDKLVATVNRNGEPNIAIMGTPRVTENGTVEFEISDPVSVTLENMKYNKSVIFMAYLPGARARDFTGARIQAEIKEILTTGEKIERMRAQIKEKHGAEKAATLLATVSCEIIKIRPIVDRGQQWDLPPLGDV